MNSSSRYRWFVVAVFFIFMLLHQSDKLLIGPLTTPIMETYGINEAQMGAVFTGALIVAAILYPVWGYLYDRYARSKLLALAAFVWGSTTWISAIAPTFPMFLASRASTGIDDSSYPGLFSLVSDYFGPQMRGRVNGMLQLTAPLGYMMGMVLALMLRDALGWRGIFYVTGSLGVLLALVIFVTVREAPRGSSEPELRDVEQNTRYRVNWDVVRGLLRKRTLLFLYAQGFFGVFPWNVLTYWAFRYLETERNYSSEAVLSTMAVAVITLSSGYVVGGALGDLFFRRTPRGRILVSAAAVLLGAVLLMFTLNVPVQSQGLFLVMLGVTSFFMPFAAPNVVSTVFDITLPEVRSTSLAIQLFLESSGAAAAPLLAGLIAAETSLKDAILIICVSAWLLCAIFFLFAAVFVPQDVETLRRQLRQRARGEQVAALREMPAG
jgi:MFS family permease